jgi:hypothetical protein
MKFEYKKNIDDVVTRHSKLWSGNFTDKILVKIIAWELGSPLSFMEELMKSSVDYKKMFDCYKEWYKKGAELLDDSIPVARASFGSAALSHYFGGEAQFTPGGIYSKPMISDLKSFDFSKLNYNPENKWIKLQMEMMEYFVKNAKGLFPVSITEVLMGLQFPDLLLGQQMYIELYDNPKLIMKMIDKSIEFNIKYIDEQRKYIERYRDGVFEMFEVWLPGNQIWNTVDVYGNCSPGMWEKFGKPYYEEIGKYYGGMWMHMHSNALHLVKEVANTKYVTGISIWDDFNAPRAFDNLEEIYKDANGIPLHIFCTKDELLSGMKNKTLKRNIYYWCVFGVEEVKEANEIMEMVYEY